jgi:hypothetical protein
MNNHTDGWVTFHRIPLHDGRVIVVQKKDGCTRTLVLPTPVADTSQRAHA